jgi:hypothetical protein
MAKHHTPYPVEFRREILELVKGGRTRKSSRGNSSPRPTRSTSGQRRPSGIRNCHDDLTTMPGYSREPPSSPDPAGTRAVQKVERWHGPFSSARWVVCFAGKWAWAA